MFVCLFRNEAIVFGLLFVCGTNLETKLNIMRLGVNV